MNAEAIFSKGEKASGEYFSHPVWVKMLHVDEDKAFDAQV